MQIKDNKQESQVVVKEVLCIRNEKKSQGYVGFGARFVIIQCPLLDFVNTPLDIRKKRERDDILKSLNQTPGPFIIAPILSGKNANHSSKKS